MRNSHRLTYNFRVVVIIILWSQYLKGLGMFFFSWRCVEAGLWYVVRKTEAVVNVED